MRDTIIFSGASHTFGLGLEWELDPELNSEEYLQKGIHIPIPRLAHYQKYWRENRWPTLVCNELGYKQFNIHDEENKKEFSLKIGGNAVETIYSLVKNEKWLKELIGKTKYVIFEVGHIRWFDETLHGSTDGYKYPNTVLEIIEVLNNPNTDNEVLAKTLEWLSKVDMNVYTIELMKKIKFLQEEYKEITFLVLPWHAGHDSITNYKDINIIDVIHNKTRYPEVNNFLQRNSLQVHHKAKAFNGNYKYNYREDHASIEGHKCVAEMVINYIKKLENDTNR